MANLPKWQQVTTGHRRAPGSMAPAAKPKQSQAPQVTSPFGNGSPFQQVAQSQAQAPQGMAGVGQSMQQAQQTAFVPAMGPNQQGGTSGYGTPPAAMGPNVPNGKASQAISFATSQIGDPYIWGAGRDLGNANPKGFDCSGLTYWAYGRAGIKLGATADAQFKGTRRVGGGLANAQPGDLIFYNFGRLGKGQADHVAIYLGNGRILHAPNRRTPVQQIQMSPAYMNSIIGVGRP